MSQLTVAQALNITQSAVSQHMKKLIDYGYIQKIRKEDRSREWGKKGAVWRVINDPRMTTKEVMSTQPQTEEEATKAAQDTIEVANRGPKGQLSKVRKPVDNPVDNYDQTLAPANISAQDEDTKYKPQLMSKLKPQLILNYNTKLEVKNSKNSFVEKEKKKSDYTHTRVRDSDQPERACRAICATYGRVMQEATGIRWQYDDRQVSIAASLLNMGYTEETFAEDAKKTAEWFISNEQKPPVSLGWFAKKKEARPREMMSVDQVLGRVKARARW